MSIEMKAAEHTERQTVVYADVLRRGWRGHVRIGFERPDVLDRLIGVGDAIREGTATVISRRHGRTTAVMTIGRDGVPIPVYVKKDRLLMKRLKHWLKDNLQVSRPRVTWQRTVQMYKVGVAVAAPVALLEQRRWGFLTCAMYVGEYASAALPLDRMLGKLASGPDRPLRMGLMLTLADEVRKFHDAGFIHADLKTGNVLAERVADGWRVTLVDLEGAIVRETLTVNDRAMDLARLWLALLPLTTETERDRFLDRYGSADPQLDRTILRRHVKTCIHALHERLFGGLPAVGAILRAGTAQAQVDSRGPWLIVALGELSQVRAVLPLCAELHRLFPDVRLELIVRPEVAAVLSGQPEFRTEVQAVLAVSMRLWGGEGDGAVLSLPAAMATVHARHYVVVIDLTDEFGSSVVTRASAATVRIGYRRSSTVAKWVKRVLCYTHMILAHPEQRAPVAHYLLVARALGSGATGTEVLSESPVQNGCSGPVVRGEW